MIDEYVKKWLIKAHNDLGVAENLECLKIARKVREFVTKKLSIKK